jgi:hypothetical protein
MPNTKPTIAETLLSMPDVGEGFDFARVEDGNDKRFAARQIESAPDLVEALTLEKIEPPPNPGRFMQN